MSGAFELPSQDDLIRLLRSRDARDQAGLFLIEGLRFVERALANDFEVLGLLHCRALLPRLKRRALRPLLASGLPVREIEEPELRALSLRAEPEGLLAVVRQRLAPPPARVVRHESFLASVAFRSPGNLGTLLRTSLATGTRTFFAIEDCDPWDPRVIRASMGAIFALDIVRSSVKLLSRWARAHGVLIAGASGEAVRDYRALPPARPLLLLLGHEAHGLSREARAACDHLVRVPMEPGVDSLNVAVAGSLLLYEAYRSRSVKVPERRPRRQRTS